MNNKLEQALPVITGLTGSLITFAMVVAPELSTNTYIFFISMLMTVSGIVVVPLTFKLFHSYFRQRNLLLPDTALWFTSVVLYTIGYNSIILSYGFFVAYTLGVLFSFTGVLLTAFFHKKVDDKLLDESGYDNGR